MSPLAQLLSQRFYGLKSLASTALALGLVFSFFVGLAESKDRWTELNIGPFYVASDTDEARARYTLTQLEQLRWVLGNLLETKELPSLWPIRIMLTGKNEGTKPKEEFVWQNSQYLLISPPDRRPPLAEIAGLLLDANTPRLPPEVESGIRQLFSTLEAHGSRVTWGGPVAHPDLAWARIQLLATRFEYGASFHIFLSALKGGSTLAAAERDAFGKPAAELEAQARANLASGNWSSVPVSGRPLDPKRDFGEHFLDANVAAVYLADWSLASDRNAAEAAYKSAIESGGSAAALGYAGLGYIAKMSGEDPKVYWDDAIRSGSHSAALYVAAADGLPAPEALPLLKRAEKINEHWSEPLYRQAQLTQDPADKEALLKAAVKLDPRATDIWTELAQLQTESGQATASQSSWLRAEESAPTDTERDRVHQMRLSSEQRRLDAAEELQRRERNAPYFADLRAQKAEENRIHAAEQKANQSLNAAAGESKPSDVVQWDSLVQGKKLSGTLTRVDCLKNGWRLSVKSKSGTVIALFLSNESHADLPCGVQPKPRHLTLEYHLTPDENLHTEGEITSFQIQ